MNYEQIYGKYLDGKVLDWLVAQGFPEENSDLVQRIGEMEYTVGLSMAIMELESQVGQYKNMLEDSSAAEKEGKRVLYFKVGDDVYGYLVPNMTETGGNYEL